MSVVSLYGSFGLNLTVPKIRQLNIHIILISAESAGHGKHFGILVCKSIFIRIKIVVSERKAKIQSN